MVVLSQRILAFNLSATVFWKHFFVYSMIITLHFLSKLCENHAPPTCNRYLFNFDELVGSGLEPPRLKFVVVVSRTLSSKYWNAVKVFAVNNLLRREKI